MVADAASSHERVPKYQMMFFFSSTKWSNHAGGLKQMLRAKQHRFPLMNVLRESKPESHGLRWLISSEDVPYICCMSWPLFGHTDCICPFQFASCCIGCSNVHSLLVPASWVERLLRCCATFRVPYNINIAPLTISDTYRHMSPSRATCLSFGRQSTLAAGGRRSTRSPVDKHLEKSDMD